MKKKPKGPKCQYCREEFSADQKQNFKHLLSHMMSLNADLHFMIRSCTDLMGWENERTANEFFQAAEWMSPSYDLRPEYRSKFRNDSK